MRWSEVRARAGEQPGAAGVGRPIRTPARPGIGRGTRFSDAGAPAALVTAIPRGSRYSNTAPGESVISTSRGTTLRPARNAFSIDTAQGERSGSSAAVHSAG